MTTPICINYGCNNKVTYSRKNTDGTKRWRIHCSACQKASYGAREHPAGVTPYKTGRCTNHDSHLGFPCPTNHNSIPVGAKGMTEVDHKDGNHCNNSPENLDELCIVCHKIKGQMSGDYNRFKHVHAVEEVELQKDVLYGFQNPKPLRKKKLKMTKNTFFNFFDIVDDIYD